MKYDHILIRYGELALKGRNKRVFLQQLQHHIQHKLRQFKRIKVSQTQGRMFILLNGENPEPVFDICKQIFGISSMSAAIKVENNEDEIKQAALYALQQSKHARTFKVVSRRVNKTFPVGSQALNHMLGGHLLTHTEGFTVDVHDPDVKINVEVREKATYITSDVVYGLGGLPVGSGSRTLLMLSGGIDSPVAGYLAMKRGVAIEAIHFHSPPYTSDRAKQKVLDLVKKLTVYGKTIRVHLVPFTKLQQAIFEEIPDGYTMTVMRRMMMRISEEICIKRGILSITTGESLGQVASQTMESMHAINAVTNLPVIRPLVTMDKSEIIDISEDINTYDISIRPYEDCCTIFTPKSPKTKPKKDRVEHVEHSFDFTPYIEEALEHTEEVKVSDQHTEASEFKDLL